MTDFDSLLPGEASLQGSSRRSVVKASLALAYAAAALPTLAHSAITTPENGLRCGLRHVDVQGFALPVYLAAPEGKSNLPVVLVVQEIFGLHAYIADTCRRLAQLGYLALAPDLYARQGDASQYSDVSKLLADIVSKVPDAQVLADLDAVRAWAPSQGGDASRVGMTGFCWGGRITWLYAAHAPMQAGVAWYGRLVGTPNVLMPLNPIDVAGRLQAPVLGLYGGMDSGIPLDTVEHMKQQLAAGSAPVRASQFVVYPQAGHAFHADYRPSYHADAAQDGWKRMLAWFAAHGLAA